MSTTPPEDTSTMQERLEVAESVVEREWAQFTQVTNEGGPAACQDDLSTFHQMRLSQFLTWPTDLLRSYAADLDEAGSTGRNLLTEKYARMMASTEPGRYAREIAPQLPALDPSRVSEQEHVVARQVAWAVDFCARYPRLGRAMRTLRTTQDTFVDTSFETYLRGELGSYSDRTFEGYARLVEETASSGGNLTEQTLRWTVLLVGYADLAEAEAAQAG